MRNIKINMGLVLLRAENDEIQRELEMVRNLSGMVEHSLVLELKKLGEWLSEEMDEIESEDRKQEFFEDYIEDIDTLKEEMPSIQRISMFLSCYISLENHLNNYCRYLKRSLGLKLKLTDISGQGIERAKKYISKVAEIEFPSQERPWREITIFNKIRNIFVHRDGYVDRESEKEVVKYIEKHKFVEITDHDKIILGSDFAPYVSEIIEQFFNDLQKRMLNRIK